MPNTSIPDRVLILGANGRLGRELTQAFAAAGWDVVAHTRQAPFLESSSVEWIDTPLASIEEIAHKAVGARVVVNALNTPAEHVREQILLNRHAIAIATALRAILLFPGNMHTFGTKVPDVVDGLAASQPDTAYGRVRARIEAEIRTAPGLQSVIIRSGDFYGGPRGSASPLERALISQLRKGVVRVLEPTAVRAWAYLPDLAHTYVTVASRRRELETHTSLVFEGHTVTATEMLTAVSRAAAAHDIITDGVRMKSISRPGLYLAGITDPAIRELGRNHHLWRRSLRMDGSRLRALGASAGTPLDTAVSQALAHIAAAC